MPQKNRQLLLMGTVFFKNIWLEVFPKVYGPSDDSFLLAESVSVKQGAKALDLGTGTGIQGINAAILGAAKVVCTDISEEALQNAGHNAKKLGIEKKFEFREGSLFGCIKKGEKFDAIIFNPPYVASGNRAKYADLDGGKKGREVLDRFLEQAKKHLRKGGKVFFVQSSLNGEKKTKKILKELGFGFEISARKKLFFEELMAFKCTLAQA